MSKSLRNKSTRFSRDGAFWGVSLCFLLSGVAGLIYQMVWMRYLSTIFGTSELAIVTVLVAYMGGLAVGAAVASKRVQSLKNPIRLYAILEGVIAASALLVPLLLKAVGGLQVAILGGQDSPPADGGLFEALAFLGLGCLVLVVPTACMGATLPILASGVIRHRKQIGSRVGWLYALNTFGAVIGTVLAAFFLIPKIGLWQTSFVAVFLNLLVAFLGWFVALRVPPREEGESTPVTEGAAAPLLSQRFGWVILGVMFFSGGISFAYEILWSRVLSHVLGGSLYAFATMLAAFLAGIAIGGLLGAKVAGSQRRSCFWLAAVEIGAGLISAVLFLYVSSTGFSETAWVDASLASLVWLCALLLMPATLCIGATFPLAVRCLCEDHRDAGRSAGRVYSWNTIGAIIGAVGAGYFLIPALGYASTFKIAIAGNLFLGAGVLILMTPRPTIAAVVSAVLAVACLAGFHPKPPLRLFTMSPLEKPSTRKGMTSKLLHYSIGHSASVAVLERGGSFLIRTNGLPEAEIFAKGADKLSYTSIRWLPALPKILRPETKSLLVVGFGGGALLEAVPSGIESIDVVELEAEVIRANEVVADRRAIDPFEDERITVIVNDVRGALRLTAKRYDAIVSQPSHPWTAGASHLYTREFFELARAHLNDNGVFVQWLGSYFVNEELLRSFAATMLKVFPHTQLYKVADNFLFVGAGTPLDDGFLAGAGPGGALFELSGYAKISRVEDVLSVLQLDEDGCRRLAGDHPIITDNLNRMATHQSLGKIASDGMNHPANLKRVLEPLHFLNQDSPKLLRAPSTQNIQLPYLTTLLMAGKASQVDLDRLAGNLMSPAEKSFYHASSLRGRDPTKAVALLGSALAADPGLPGARALEVQLRLVSARKNWFSRGLGPAPHELASLVAEDAQLQAALAQLSAAEREVVEAQHWLLTGQNSRLHAVAEKMEAFTDHRDPFYQVAVRIRLGALLEVSGKSEQAQEEDALEAREVLDHLLALPTVDNARFMMQRIQLAQRFDETGYLIAAGWIMARKLGSAPANTPERMKEAYRRPLGAILKPYFKKSRGRIEFSNPAMRNFYNDVRGRLGEEIFPLEYRK
ncbi:MAG: fused MFS/spermidine synthase [Roseibacillus sp.]|nr:fused MFS/spermidine synthase [Roseibacillus sp.]